MSDLKSSKLMYLKAALFVTIATASAALLLFENPSIRTGLLVALFGWASARAYYFLFYVIQTYIDGDFKYSGIVSCLKHLASKKRTRGDEDSPSA